MLDPHNLPLSFLGPPLAALHSMAEMKATSNGGNGVTFHDQKPTQTQLGPHGAANPHGIDTILSRPPPTTSAGMNAMSTGKSITFKIIINASSINKTRIRCVVCVSGFDRGKNGRVNIGAF